MLEDLGKLIQVIQNNYERICSMWNQQIKTHLV